MCVLFVAYQLDPDYPLIIAANRDEFYERPTAPVHFWKDQPDILAGRDLRGMGTWMGISKTGSFAALTNFRDPFESTENKISRGQLVKDYLETTVHTRTFLESQEDMRDMYRGYNLIAGNEHSLFYYSNVQNKIEELEPGIYGLSNHFLNTLWPKVVKGSNEMRCCLEKEKKFKRDCFFSFLKNRERAEDNQLPDTGIGLEWEKQLSSIYIETEQYGTRSSSVLTISKERIVDFTEYRFIKNREIKSHYSFSIQQ